MQLKHLNQALALLDPEMGFVTHANNHTTSTYDIGRQYYDSMAVGVLKNTATGKEYAIIGNFSFDYYNKCNEREPVVKLVGKYSFPDFTLAEAPEEPLNKSMPVLGQIGSVTCIDVSQKGTGELRYFASSGKGHTGPARLTRLEAETDVRNWHEGKPIDYVQEAVSPLVPNGTTWDQAAQELGLARLAPAAAAGKDSAFIPAYRDAFIAEADWHHKSENSFVIGAGNEWPQALAALYEGHPVYQSSWPENTSWILESNSRSLMVVHGSTKADWLRTAEPVRGGYHGGAWIVRPKIDVEPPVV